MGIEAVVKVGGSLSAHPRKLKSLCRLLARLSAEYRLILAPGGGTLADEVRRLDGVFKLKAEASHWMAILATNQYGLLLADLTPRAEAVESLSEALRLTARGRPTIFLPYKLLRRENPFKPSWEAASDAIAAYLAWRLKAERLILLKDVDGVYEPPYPGGKLLAKTTVERLEAWKGKTCLDPLLPSLLARYRLPCLVASGLHPERVEKILAHKPVRATLIEV